MVNWELFIPVAVLAVLIHTVVGLLAIWIGLGRTHWFVGTAVLGGLLGAGVLVGAYEPVAVFFLQAVIVVAVLWTYRAVRRRHVRFSLGDLLLVAVIVSAVAAFLARVPVEKWLPGGEGSFLAFAVDWYPVRMMGGPGSQVIAVLYGCRAVAFSLSTLIAAWAAFGKRWPIARGLAVLLVPISLLTFAWLRLACRSGWIGSAASSQRRGAARAGLVVLSLVIAVPPLAVGSRQGLQPSPVPALLPSPNGYDTILAAAGRISPGVYRLSDQLDAASDAELRRFVEQNRAALDLARRGLAQPSQVPVTYTFAHGSATNLTAPRDLAWAFLVEAQLAAREGDLNKAAAIHCGSLRLGQSISRGGLLIELLAGLGVQRIGIDGMGQMRAKLDASQCRHLVFEIHSFDRCQPDFNEFSERERLWVECVMGWAVRLGRALGVEFRELATANRTAADAADRLRARLRLLECELALRAYRLEKGRLPERLGELVPDYVPEVPLDPFSGRPLVYRKTKDEYLLYSLGADRIDGGGVQVEPWQFEGDLFLDPPASSANPADLNQQEERWSTTAPTAVGG